MKIQFSTNGVDGLVIFEIVEIVDQITRFKEKISGRSVK